MPLSRLSALIKDLFSSSESFDMEDVASEITPAEIRSSALTYDLTTATAHFNKLNDQKMQLTFIGELIGIKSVPNEVITGLVHLYSHPDSIYMRMKQELAAADMHLLDLKVSEETITKETFLQMHNELLFQKFPKSTLAKNAITALLSEMT
jgi:hypothetical protein